MSNTGATDARLNPATFDAMHAEDTGCAESQPNQTAPAQTLVCPPDSRRKQTTSVETLIRLTGLTPLPMHSALAFVKRIERYVDTVGAVLGSTCFVCLDAVDVDDGTTIVPFAKTGVCGLCQRSLLEDKTTGDLKGFKCLSSDGVKAIQLFLLLLEGIRESEHWMQPLGVTAQQSCFVCVFLEQTVDDVELFHDGATVGLK